MPLMGGFFFQDNNKPLYIIFFVLSIYQVLFLINVSSSVQSKNNIHCKKYTNTDIFLVTNVYNIVLGTKL